MILILQMSDSTLRPNTVCWGCTWFPYEKCRESDKYGHNHFPLLILPEEFADDLGSYFVLGKAEPTLFLTSKRCVPVKNTLGRSAVIFCEHEVIQFSVVFCAVRAQHQFDFITWTPEIWRPVERSACSDGLMCLTVYIYMFSPARRREC